MREGAVAEREKDVLPIPQVSNRQCLACAYSYSQNCAGQPLEDRDDCLPRGGNAINGILDRTRGSIVLHAQCRSGRSRRALGVDCFEAQPRTVFHLRDVLRSVLSLVRTGRCTIAFSKKPKFHDTII